MLTLYKHVVTVIVLTPECSPDVVIQAIEGLDWRGRDTRIEASVTPEARSATPFMRVPDPPAWTPEDRPGFFTRMDQWTDNLPTVEAFREDRRC